MLKQPHIRRATWTLIDQGIVSAGTFALNLILARHIAAAEYGTFVLLYGSLLTLQLVNTTLLLFPLSVRLAVAAPEDRPRMMAASLVLIAVLSAALCVVVAVIVAALGRPDLLLPTFLCFIAWQLQETLRRGLFANFRHQRAAIGDAATYLGQGAVVLALASRSELSLASILYALAGTFVLGGLIHACHLRIRVNGPLSLRETALEYWRTGGYWSLGNGILAQTPGVVLPWCLAAITGPAAVGAFQAANNIVNLSNPLLIGLGNIIPQAASVARARGNRQAWLAARRYAWLATPALIAYSALVLALPGTVLSIFYGQHSQYGSLTLPLSILILSRVASCLADVVIAYLHGIDEVRLAFIINVTGAAFAILLAWPATVTQGLVGVSLTVGAVQLIRFVLARSVLLRTISHSPSGRQARYVASPAVGPAQTFPPP